MDTILAFAKNPGALATAGNMLDKLAKKSLIIRERISQDQRVVTVTVTEAGAKLINLASELPQGILQHSLFGA